MFNITILSFFFFFKYANKKCLSISISFFNFCYSHNQNTRKNKLSDKMKWIKSNFKFTDFVLKIKKIPAANNYAAYRCKLYRSESLGGATIVSICPLSMALS